MKKEWNYIAFNFKTLKDAYKLYRFISFGKEIGIIPETIEIMLEGKKITLGHWNK